MNQFDETDNIIQGLFPNEGSEINFSLLSSEMKVNHVAIDSTGCVIEDSSKGVDREHWEALSPEAQKALRDNGFYPILKIKLYT